MTQASNLLLITNNLATRVNMPPAGHTAGRVSTGISVMSDIGTCDPAATDPTNGIKTPAARCMNLLRRSTNRFS
jgi:hypothetical protein